MHKFLYLVAVAVILAGLNQQAVADGSHMAVLIKKGSFEEVKESVEAALTGRGYVINNVSRIGEMLERTGKDLGGKRQLYLKAEALEFCSATVSRTMMEADADNIVFCPYIIVIYVLPAKPDEVRVGFRNALLVGSAASKKALSAVNELLTGIIKEAIQ